jgi:hypothetical protein
VIAANYCDICNPFGYAKSIMGNANGRRHIKDAIDFFNDVATGNLPYDARHLSRGSAAN